MRGAISCSRYIFETKENKQADTKGKKTKDEEGEVSREKTIARLQVGVMLFFIYPFINSNEL